LKLAVWGETKVVLLVGWSYY